MTTKITRRGILAAAPAVTWCCTAEPAQGSPSACPATSLLSLTTHRLLPPQAANARGGMRLGERRTFTDYGAAGEGGGDDGPAMRRAITDLGPAGDKLWLTKGWYLASASEGAVLTLAAPISIEGDGASASVLEPAIAGPADDTIRLSPNPNFDHSGIRLTGFALHSPVNGRRTGRHGLHIDTSRSAGQNLANLLIDSLAIGESSGLAILHTNDPDKNPNGGLYGSTIARNQLKGGIRLSGSGDNIHVQDNIISGPNIGLDIDLVAGASCLSVIGCNITSTNGAIRQRRGHRITYAGLNIEHTRPGALAGNAGVIVNISGESGPIVGGALTDSLVSGFGSSDATHLIRIANTRGFTLDRLTLLWGLARPVVAIEIASSAQDTRIGALQLQARADGTFTLPIVDNGVGTMGLVKTAALARGWKAASSADTPLQFLKGLDGVVRLWGTTDRADASDGALLTTLPAGFRPSQSVRFPMLGISHAGAMTSELAIAPDGTVTARHLAAATTIAIDCSFAASRLGHAIAPE